MGGPARTIHLHPPVCQMQKDIEEFTTCELLFKSFVLISSLVPEKFRDSFLIFSLSLLPSLPSSSFSPSSFSPPFSNRVFSSHCSVSANSFPVPHAPATWEGSCTVVLTTFSRENLSEQLRLFLRQAGRMKGWSSPATHVNNYHPIS